MFPYKQNLIWYLVESFHNGDLYLQIFPKYLGNPYIREGIIQKTTKVQVQFIASNLNGLAVAK